MYMMYYLNEEGSRVYTLKKVMPNLCLNFFTTHGAISFICFYSTVRYIITYLDSVFSTLEQ